MRFILNINNDNDEESLQTCGKFQAKVCN